MSKRTGNIPLQQKMEMIDFMESHPKLRMVKFSKDFTFKTAQSLWIELANNLNSLPAGAEKDWKQWRKTWQDLKGNVKKKNVQIKHHRCGTGGGPPLDSEFTDVETKMVNLIGTVSMEGDSKILETATVFEWDDTAMEEVIPFDNTDHIYSANNEENSSSNCGFISTTVSVKEGNETLQDHAIKVNAANYTADTPKIHKATKEETSTNGNKKRGVRVQRLNKAIDATDKLVKLTERKIVQKENYLTAKLELYKQDIAVKNRIANSLEKLCERFNI